MLNTINYILKKALMLILNMIGDFIRISENRGLHLAIKILLLYIFLQLFYAYLVAEFFPGINSKWIQFTLFFPNKFEITGRKTFLVRCTFLWCGLISLRRLWVAMTAHARLGLNKGVLQHSTYFHVLHKLMKKNLCDDYSKILFWDARLW